MKFFHYKELSANLPKRFTIWRPANLTSGQFSLLDVKFKPGDREGYFCRVKLAGNCNQQFIHEPVVTDHDDTGLIVMVKELPVTDWVALIPRAISSGGNVIFTQPALSVGLEDYKVFRQQYADMVRSHDEIEEQILLAKQITSPSNLSRLFIGFDHTEKKFVMETL